MRSKVLIAVALLVVAACGGGGAEPTTGTIEVTAIDYGFEDVPDLVASGAELTLTNSSEAEFHEMVVFKAADGETRTLEELLQLPDEEVESALEFQGVLVALPGEEGSAPGGEGNSVTVTEPGRYAMVCFIPQGADPAVVAEAMSGATEGPPDLEGGTPHAFLGMAREFTVEG